MREKYNRQLEILNMNLREMGALCEEGISCAVDALLSGDKAKAGEAIRIEEDTNEKEREIENLCLKLLLKQQPVASDFRQISSALKIITDMERIGDQAADIAAISKNGVVCAAGSEHIKAMSEAVSKMVTESVDAFVCGNLKLVRDVISRDDEVDSLFINVRDDIAAAITEHPDNAAAALDLLMIAKYLERIGDHAVNIAEWVEFSITGEHK